MHKRSLENLSDLELHKKLLEYGLPNVPITETTRPLLIKKLKTHIQSSRRSERSSSKTGIPTTNEISSSSSSSNHNNNSGNNLNHYIAGTTSSASATSTSTRPYQSLTAKELQNNTYNERASLPISLSRETQPTITTTTITPTTRTYLNNLSAGSNIYKRHYAPSSSDSEDDGINYGNSVLPQRQHYGVVGRLLNLRDNTLQHKKSPFTQHDYMDYVNKRSSSIYNQTKPSYSSTAAAAAAAAYNQQTFYQRMKAFARSWRGFKQLHIPHAIIFVFVLFLTIIVSVYLIKHPDITNLIRESNTHFTLCTDLTPTATGIRSGLKPFKNCLEQQQLTTAIEHSREIIQLLHKQAVQHYCVNHTLPITLSTHEFVRHLVSARNVWDMQQVLRDFQASVYLIKQNPHWNVRILSDVGTILTDNALQAYVAHGDTRFTLLKPNLPISCVLYNKLQRFFVITGIGALVFSICLIVYLAFRFIQQRRLEKQTTIGNFCTEIVNEVLYQATANEGEPHEVPLTHLRDKLIPLNKRKKLMKAWNEALKLLESYESRIQFVVCERNGEEVRCARWTGNLLSDSRDLSFRKQWQSPAFDNGNRICNPPTPCLKIRHMFDTTEVKHPNLKKVIEEAIFEKVGSRCNILDIQLDLSTCCVYVRCASEEDAGIVHNEINGWWFDKRLVSIKFLRLQRYLARFPESKT